MRVWRFLMMCLLVSLTLAGPVLAAADGVGGDLPLAPDGFWAGRPGVPMGPGGPGMVGPGMVGPSMVGPGRMLDSLDLSATQKERLKELGRARRDRIQKLANSFDDAREDFEDLLNSGARGAEFEQKIRAKHSEMVALQQALDAQIFESILEIRGLLSPAQLKKFNKMHKLMGFHGPGGADGPEPWGHFPGRVREPEVGK